jgi:hypothetical protein
MEKPAMKQISTGVASAAALLLGACATDPPAAPLGGAVQSMVKEQTFDPGASVANADKAPQGTDADRAAAALKAHREGVAKSSEVWTSSTATGTR